MINANKILDKANESKDNVVIRDLTGIYKGVFIEYEGKIYSACLDTCFVKKLPPYIRNINDAKSYLDRLNLNYKKGFNDGQIDIQKGLRKLINFDFVDPNRNT